MKIENPHKSVAFIEQDEDFVKKIACDIGCNYTKTNDLTYRLGNSKKAAPKYLAAFAWVHKAEKDNFWVATRKQWLDQVKSKVRGVHLPPNFEDGDSVSFETRNNYLDTIKILKLINKLSSTSW